MADFKFPDVGEGITEGTLIKWLVKEGDSVKEDQVLAEVETDKAVVEVPSPQSGKITKLHKKAKDKIKVGEVIVSFDGGAAPVKKATKAEAKAPAKRQAEEQPVKDSENKKPEAAQPKEAPKQSVKTTQEVTEAAKTLRPLATPHTRRLARERGVDLTAVKGSGANGRITDEDVESAAKSTPASSAIPSTQAYVTPTKIEGEKRVPLTSIRSAIAKKMSESMMHAAHVTHHDVADVTELAKIREKEKPAALKRGVKLTFLPFIAKAALAALKEFSEFNSSLDESTNEIVYHEKHNLGMALATDDGLLVPVIFNADEKSILELGKEMHALADKGRARKLKLDEMRGSTFTITNVGSVGGTYFTPIINYPECAILGIGKIMDEQRVIDGKAQTRKIAYLSLSFDHRIVDGAQAAKFMNAIIRHLEDPALLLVDS